MLQQQIHFYSLTDCSPVPADFLVEVAGGGPVAVVFPVVAVGGLVAVVGGLVAAVEGGLAEGFCAAGSSPFLAVGGFFSSHPAITVLGFWAVAEGFVVAAEGGGGGLVLVLGAAKIWGRK